ncbi:hypothetical protein ACFLY6_02750 [Candidatus Dependentiae bacterium]
MLAVALKNLKTFIGERDKMKRYLISKTIFCLSVASTNLFSTMIPFQMPLPHLQTFIPIFPQIQTTQVNYACLNHPAKIVSKKSSIKHLESDTQACAKKSALRLIYDILDGKITPFVQDKDINNQIPLTEDKIECQLQSRGEMYLFYKLGDFSISALMYLDGETIFSFHNNMNCIGQYIHKFNLNPLIKLEKKISESSKSDIIFKRRKIRIHQISLYSSILHKNNRLFRLSETIKKYIINTNHYKYEFLGSEFLCPVRLQRHMYKLANIEEEYDNAEKIE